MKRQDLFLLTFLLSQTAPVWAMEFGIGDIEGQPIHHLKNPNKPFVDQAQRLKKSIQEGIAITDRKIAEHNPLDTKVIIIGHSGVGKSTLLNLLVEKQLVIDNRLRIDVIKPIPGSEPGHGTKSKTRLISLCGGPNNIVLCDCPGFGDTGGPEIDIMNLGMIRKVFVGPVKILLAVPETDLSRRADTVLKQINYITKMFSYSQLEEGLSLVITKQGEINGGVGPHERLREILEEYTKPKESSQETISLINEDSIEDGFSQEDDNLQEASYLMTEDVRKLLTHLTKEENIRTRIPYFPFPKEVGKYDAEGVKTNILQSIKSLAPITNPELKIELSPESSLLILQLAEELNKDIETSIENIGSKFIDLSKKQTTAYRRDGSMQGLANNIRIIRSVLPFLEQDSPENMLRFADSFDGLFDHADNNAVKEGVKSLMFLKTLKNDDITCLTSAWKLALESTLDKMHGSIDLLVVKLFQKVTTFVDRLNTSVMQCYTTLPESDNGEAYVEVLKHKLDVIKEAKTALQNATPKTMKGFVHPLRNFFDSTQTTTIEGSIDSIENYLGILGTLSKLKEINTYPKAEWLMFLNSSSDHLQNAITTQQKILDLNVHLAAERQLQEELLATRQRQEEELRRLAEEETARQQREAIERAELLRQIDIQRQQLEAEHQAQVVATERQAQEIERLGAAVELERQRQAELFQQQQNIAVAAAAAERQLQQELVAERQRQEEERSRLAGVEAERLQRESAERAELIRQLDTQRQLLETERQSQVTATERQSQDIARLTAAVELERQRQAESLQQQQRLADTEATAKRQLQEELSRTKLKMEDEQKRYAEAEAERQRREQAEANRQLMSMLETQRQAQETLMKQLAEKDRRAEELQKVQATQQKLQEENARKAQTETTTKFKTLEDKIAETERKRLADLEALRKTAEADRKKVSDNQAVVAKELAAAQQREADIKKQLAAAQKIIDDRKAEDKRIADAKVAEDKRIAAAKIAADKIIADAKIAAAQKLAAEKQRVLKIPVGTKVSKADYDLLPAERRRAQAIIQTLQQKRGKVPLTYNYYKK